jgi:beta-phosphoglucomutase
MKPYKAYIFDMNGTIIDDMPYHIISWLDMLAELGHPMTAEAFHRRFAGRTNVETLLEVLGPDTPLDRIEAISRKKEEHYQAIYREHMAPLPGFIALLEALQANNKPVALATSANQFNIDYILQGLGLEDAFTAVISADDIEYSKPHPEIFLKAAAAMGAAPEDCLVFEDSFMGIEAARRANMDAYAILTTLSADEVLALPNVIGASSNFLDIPHSFLRSD